MNDDMNTMNKLLKRSFEKYLPICCANCGHDYTHQFETHVFERPEDAKTGNHVAVRGDMIEVDRNIKANPSTRRHGVSIFLNCESCEGITAIDIIQHKGNTLIQVRKL